MTESPCPPAEAGAEERARIENALRGLDCAVATSIDGSTTVEASPKTLKTVLQRLRDRAGLESCSFVTAVDHSPDEPRFVLNHQLHSVRHNARVRVHTPLEGDAPRAASCADLWPGATFMERECYDMFGIEFDAPHGKRRLLMPDEFEHFPLRKEFPHEGIEPDKLYREWDRKRRAEWQEGQA